MQAGALSTSPNAGIPQGARKKRAADEVVRAAGVAFVTPGGEALFVKRAPSSDNPGTWCFPGGTLEDGESPEDAARREALEEVGGKADKLVEVDRRTSPEGVDFTTFGQRIADKFEPVLDAEHVDHAWAPLDAPPEPLHPGVLAMLEADEPGIVGDDFNESDHPRDQGGKFTAGSGAGGGASPHGGEAAEAARQTRAKVGELLKKHGMSEEGFHEVMAALEGGEGQKTQEELRTIAERAKAIRAAAAAHAKKAKEILSSPGASKAIAKGLADHAKHHGHGVIEMKIRQGLMLPAMHSVAAMAIGEHIAHGTSVPAIVATAVATYAVHHLADMVGITPRNAMKALKWGVGSLVGAVKGGAEAYRTGSELRSQFERARGATDAEPQEEGFAQALEAFLASLEQIPEDELSDAMATDSCADVKRVEVEFVGDFNMAGLLRALWWLGQAGASRTVEVAAGDPETQRELPDGKCKFGWDGDGADKIRSARIDGVDVVKGGHLAEDSKPRTLYLSRKLLNGGALVDWATGLGLKPLPAEEMHVTVAFSKTPTQWPAPDADGVRAIGGERSVKRLGNEGAVVLAFRCPELEERWSELREAGASWDHDSYQPHVTFTMIDPDARLDRDLPPYEGALDFGPEVMQEIGGRDKDWAAKARASLAGDAAALKIDRSHGVKWLSVMSRDGQTVHVDQSVPEQLTLDDATFDPAEPLARHEGAERDWMEERRAEFVRLNGREPNDEERKAIYLEGHVKAGTPAEKRWFQERGLIRVWPRWLAWCRGKLAELENTDPANPPDDPDVKPFRHEHGELELAGDMAFDRAMILPFEIAQDRESVRDEDHDGRLHVAVANICKACVSPYVGKEIPGWEELGLDPRKVYRLLRDPEELRKAVDTANGIQVLREHKPVNAKDHKPWDTVGALGTTAAWEHPYIKNGMTIWSADDIDDVKSGKKRSLSPGYRYSPDMTPGIFDGESFDGIMRNIQFNHIALVEKGRQGDDVVVGDSGDGIIWSTLESLLLSFLP